MDPKFSALNRAHSEDRKAERFYKAGNWKGAIESRRTALEYLDEALREACSDSVAYSITVQLDHNRRQIALLEHWDKLQTKQQEAELVNMEKTAAVMNVQISQGVVEESEDIIDGKTEDALQTMQECDTLLVILDKRFRYGHRDPRVTPISGVKIPKGSEVIIEELRIRNKDLCSHVVKLLEESEMQAKLIDHLKTENMKLRSLQSIELNASVDDNLHLVDKIDKSSQSSLAAAGAELPVNSAYFESKEDAFEVEEDNHYYDLNVGVIGELPPLEIPQFDYGPSPNTKSSPQ